MLFRNYKQLSKLAKNNKITRQKISHYINKNTGHLVYTQTQLFEFFAFNV